MGPGTPLEDFAERGYVVVREAFPRAVAEACVALARQQLRIPAEPPWPAPVVRGPVAGEAIATAARSSRLVETIRAVVGRDDWVAPPTLGNLVVRFPSSAPHDDPGDTGWHVDAAFPGPEPGAATDYLRWRVNHRCRGRALTLLCLLSDTGPDDAPTRLLDGSHRDLAERLEPYGDEGTTVFDAPYPDSEGYAITLATGGAGDVYICHPLLVHAATWPHHGTSPRFLAQPGVTVAGP